MDVGNLGFKQARFQRGKLQQSSPASNIFLMTDSPGRIITHLLTYGPNVHGLREGKCRSKLGRLETHLITAGQARSWLCWGDSWPGEGRAGSSSGGTVGPPRSVRERSCRKELKRTSNAWREQWQGVTLNRDNGPNTAKWSPFPLGNTSVSRREPYCKCSCQSRYFSAPWQPCLMDWELKSVTLAPPPCPPSTEP